MKKENLVNANVRELPGRITRSRTAALVASRQMPPLKAPVQQNKKRALQTNPKRVANDENNSNPDNACVQRKRRVVLHDVTNVFCDHSYANCFNKTKIQAKSGKPDKKDQAKVTKVTPSVATEFLTIKADTREKTAKEIAKAEFKSEGITSSENLEENLPHWLYRSKAFGKHDPFGSQSSEITSELRSPLDKEVEAEKGNSCGNINTFRSPDIVDVDIDHKDPQLCCIYAPDIYDNLRVSELTRRPCPNFMEMTQQDITRSMRGILVDWLVEVSEEYNLAPDTLYLTVYLIDRFLSENYIERQRLQLIGITCMLIASKYEEICAPRVEEFCFITDNTYTREEVLKMEVQVLKYFNFQLFAPTAKTFLRRFLRAAQASYKCPSLELEYLATYLAELTLIDYGFLSFLPSVIAASAVFLSRWTLDRTSHPWNPTLEHYTSYKASDLKTAIFALQDLQLNTNGCPLSAIRMKYRQEKFKSVAALSSPELLETLF
ncbi:Cyclin [Trema orientale]|uniref:B-like cyclin n=1 Tax=Trema orientale TaxID=63057 RepID=A0A2P5CCW5_TREOI|nr:Cyclin [Trema orientale]